MDRIENNVKAFAKAERGHGREEFYTMSRSEEFGLSKRTRRVARGDKSVTTPDGKKFCHDGSATGKKD